MFDQIKNSALLHSAGNLYWKDTASRYLGCNLTFAKIAGVHSPADIIGKTDRDLFFGRMDEEFILILNRTDKSIIQDDKESILEEVGIDEKGDIAYYLTKKIPIKNQNGSVIGLIGTSLNITEEKKMSEIKDIVLSNSAGNLYWKNKSGNYLGCNLALAEVLGFQSANDVIGKSDYDLLSNKIEEHEIENIVKVDKWVMENNVESVVEEIGLNSKNEKTYYLTKKIPLKDKMGKIIGVMGTSLDITELKNTQKKLEQAKKLAEASDSAKTAFLRNMRHDIRTPLMGIMGFAELMKQENDPIKIKEYADHLIASSKMLSRLLDEILEEVNVASGNLPILQEKFNLKEKIESIMALTRSVALEKKLLFELEYDPAIPMYLIGDSKRIHRILLELVTNALKFTEKGYVKVTVSIAKRKKQKLVLMFSVTDTGKGMREDQKDEVYLRFNRFTPSYEGVYKGTGLGLSIAKKFIDDIQAEIYVKSEIGKGTTFTCFVPLREALIENSFGIEKTLDYIPPKFEEFFSINDDKKTKYTSMPIDNHTTSIPNILLVEDNEVAAMAVSGILKKLDYQVDIAINGYSAIALAKERSYKLILLDIGLPDMSGHEVAKKIRSLECCPLIVALTAHMDSEGEKECLDAGIDAILMKPLDKEKIKEFLSAV